MKKERLSRTDVRTNDSRRRAYEAPRVTTYTDEQLLDLLGPAQMSYHVTPNFVTGGR